MKSYLSIARHGSTCSLGGRHVGRPLSGRRLKETVSLDGLTRLGAFRSPHAGRITLAAGARASKKGCEIDIPTTTAAVGIPGCGPSLLMPLLGRLNSLATPAEKSCLES